MADSDELTLLVNRQELVLINNALNEVCHGVNIEEAEFHARLGGSRDEARAVLHRVGQLLEHYGHG